MWPNLIWAIFFIIVIVIFYKDIKDILSGFSKKGKVQYKGFNIELGSSTPTLYPSQQESGDAKHLELQKTYQSSIIHMEETTIKGQLIEAKLTSDQAINVLVYHLAYANLAIKLFAIDKLIFQEQVKLLLHLNTRFKPCPESDLLLFYDEWKTKNPKADYPFKSFLEFLSQQRLVFQNIDGYVIASLGKEYLAFLIKIGRPLPFDISKDK
jgi:hypothetical protein